MGLKTKLLDNFILHIEAEFDPQDGDPVYRRLTDSYVGWNPSEAFELTVGKHSAAFTMDGLTSSKELLVIDRSALTNNIWFTEEYIPGVSAKGEINGIFIMLVIFPRERKIVSLVNLTAATLCL
jgi:phosphate-selective porin